MKKRFVLVCALAICLLFILTGCIPGDGTYTRDDPAGFFWGIWHGWLAPVSLIIGLFDHNIRVYETVNTGWWYDFGFYIAVICGFGGISLSRSRKQKEKKRNT